MLRRLVLTTATAALVSAAAPAAGALALPVGGLPPLPLLSSPDRLTVTVSKSVDPAANGTFELECGANGASGNHPAADGACTRLGQLAARGEDPFAPPAEDRMCTQQYGGAAVAHITGTWQGRSVDARFSRADGCEIDRWENLEPVLPLVRR
ncbi:MULTISPECIES: SSI family serine proteinase inhibitor [Streptomyces]|uniref:SSI family serine proteinase inhibitor n=1 Tax=Streptomyces solicathayae TaxID=3081768 RepID=A0ABZ0LVB6_9ACTN|nr:SSI family serine proteinase inhibitor [Streptomyces sp. HUAS YS2]WOX23377.1 SSI family serine proteinase inhibitor [Streptomyces sp. HUAS YS2]